MSVPLPSVLPSAALCSARRRPCVGGRPGRRPRQTLQTTVCAFLQLFLRTQCGYQRHTCGDRFSVCLVNKFFVMYFFRNLKMAFAQDYFHSCFYLFIHFFVNMPHLIFKICF